MAQGSQALKVALDAVERLALWESLQNGARYCGHQISISNQGAKDGYFN
jgi:hypothetical protein